MYKDRFTGLYHTHFREYDAVHGRWLSEDPAGYADGLNLYQAYMGVNGTDPLGLDIWDDEIASIRRGNATWGNRGLQKVDRGAVIAGHTAIAVGRGVVEPLAVAVDATTNVASAITGQPIGTNISMTCEKGGFLDQYESLKREDLSSGATPWEAQFTASLWSAGEYTGINNLANAIQGERITFDAQGGLSGQVDVRGWGRAWEGGQGVGKLASCYAVGAKGAGYLGNVKGKGVASSASGVMKEVDNAEDLGDVSRGVNQVDEIGEYGRVGGHHIHAQAGFKNHVSYNPDKGFSISQEYMKNHGWRHQVMTNKQRELFIELARSGRPNTMREHTNIAVAALKEAGATTQEARDLVSKSLRNLRQQGIRKPTNIPWD